MDRITQAGWDTRAPGSTAFLSLQRITWLVGIFRHSQAAGTAALVLQIHGENDMAWTKQGITTFIGFSKLCHKLYRMIQNKKFTTNYPEDQIPRNLS